MYGDRKRGIMSVSCLCKYFCIAFARKKVRCGSICISFILLIRKFVGYAIIKPKNLLKYMDHLSHFSRLIYPLTGPLLYARTKKTFYCSESDKESESIRAQKGIYSEQTSPRVARSFVKFMPMLLFRI